MNNFVFHNPTKILFGRNTISSIGSETAQLGTRGLLVYGSGSIKKNGIYQQVTDSLKLANVEITDHGGVQSNPLLSQVRQGIAKVKEHNLDVIIAVGGGSVLDCAKAITAGSLVEHDVWKFFTGKKSLKKTLPLTTVLTLAASGSEMNSGMVITNEITQEKFGFGHRLLYPKTSILDPETTYSVPADYTAFGAVDAIAHVLEFYMTAENKNAPVQDRLMEGLIINAMESCEKCLTNPQGYQGRADLMWTATLALNGLTAAGLGRVGFPMHMIEHSLSALYNIPHGAGLSAIMPGWLKWKIQTDPQKTAQLGQRVFNIDTSDKTKQATQTIDALSQWFDKVNSPTSLSSFNIPETDIPHIAKNALALAKIWRLKEYSAEIIEKILRLCLEGGPEI